VLGRCSELSRSAAQVKLDEVLRPLNSPTEARGRVIFRCFVEETYLPFCRQHRWKESSAMSTENRIQVHLVPEFGERDLGSLRREELQQFLERKAAAGLSFSTVDHLRWDLRAIFDMSAEDGYVGRNPAASLSTPRTATIGEKRVMDRTDVVKAIAVLDLRERLIFKLATICGMRPGEIFGLKWGHLHDQHLQVRQRVYKGKVDSPKTRRSVRKVALPPGVAADVRAWRDIARDGSPDAWVFPSERLTTPLSKDNVWRRNIWPKLKAVGVGWVNFQVMRRTHSTQARATGADPKVVADQLGHGIRVNLEEYTVARLDELVEAVTKVESALVM